MVVRKPTSEITSSSGTENVSRAIVEVDVHESVEDSNFILNKFLNDSNNLMVDDVNMYDRIKAPVPLPRKLRNIHREKAAVCVPGINSYTINKDLLNHSEDNIRIKEKTTNPLSSISTDSSRSKTKLIDDHADIISLKANSLSGCSQNTEKIELANLQTDQVTYENETVSIQKRQNNKLEKNSQYVAESKEKQYEYGTLMGITIHKTDRLKFDSLIIHPLVKIHIVEMDTGNYLTKSDKSRSVLFFYENKDIEYITPMLCEPYKYDKSSSFPEWEETLLINDDINYMLESNIIIFFEIIDFVSFAVASSQSVKPASSKGWHRIAWAFLKLLGKNGEKNINKKVRLQLYYSHKYKKNSPCMCPMFHWWKNKQLVKYPSSLYVSVCEMKPPEHISETLRSKTPMQGEKASMITLETDMDSKVPQNTVSSADAYTTSDNIDEKPIWSRASYQTCKIPNRRVAELPSFEEGCFVVKFSNNGLYIACAILVDAIYSIVIFKVKTFEEAYRYSVHQGLIYDINWSMDDQNIVTSSADCTVSVWNFTKRSFAEMLPHPSYIYASNIDKDGIVATGCYDNIVRIWRPSSKGPYDLIQELDGHKGYVTSLCFSSKNPYLYSSDSVGVVIEWKKKEESWELKRELKWIDLRDIIINQILLHKRERRLLINARDSTLRMIDLKTGCTMQWLQGATNNRFRTVCSFSPCGTYVFAGGEFGLVCVWNTDLGQLVATYYPYSTITCQNITIHCVQFHPHDNILAISHYGSCFPILLAVFDIACSESNLRLKILQKDAEICVDQIPINSSGRSEREKKNFSAQKMKANKIKFNDVIDKMNEIMDKQPKLDGES